MQKRMVVVGVVACVLALVVGGLCIAQPPQGGPRGMRGQFDPAQRQQRMAEMRQRMMDGFKEELKVDDEAWKVMEPRLAKVMELNQAQGTGGRGMGMMFLGRSRGGNRPPRDPNTMTPVERALEQLRTTVDDESATPEEINKQLTGLRQARENARRELAMAQAELQKILTPRQEALLVLRGQLQ